MRPLTESNLNGLKVDVAYLDSCTRTPCDPVTNPDPGAIFFTAGTSAADQYGVTPEAGRVDSGMPAGQTLVRFTQTETEAGFVYGGSISGVTDTYINYTPEDPGPPVVPAIWTPALWQATDERGIILAQGTTTYNHLTNILTLTPIIGNGPRWQVNDVATLQVFPQ